MSEELSFFPWFCCRCWNLRATQREHLDTFYFISLQFQTTIIMIFSDRSERKKIAVAVRSFHSVQTFKKYMHLYNRNAFLWFFLYSIPKVAGSPPVNERSIGNCQVLCSAKYNEGCCCWHIKSNRRHTYTLLSTLVYQRDCVKIENAVASWELGSS